MGYQVLPIPHDFHHLFKRHQKTSLHFLWGAQRCAWFWETSHGWIVCFPRLPSGDLSHLFVLSPWPCCQVDSRRRRVDEVRLSLVSDLGIGQWPNHRRVIIYLIYIYMCVCSFNFGYLKNAGFGVWGGSLLAYVGKPPYSCAWGRKEKMCALQALEIIDIQRGSDLRTYDFPRCCIK